MIEQASCEAVADAHFGKGWVKPLYDRYSFAHLPRVVQALLTDDHTTPVPFDDTLVQPYDCVVLFLIDAFGWRFLERFGDHPFLQRLTRDGSVAQLTSQFPSTTTAHVTTIHSGLPVGEHGLYEWYAYDPSIDAIIAPLLFSRAGDTERETLRGTLDPTTLYPSRTIYQSLRDYGVHSTTFFDAAYASSPFTRTLGAGTRIVPFSAWPTALHDLGDLVANQQQRSYYFLYFDRIDTACHVYGPDSPQADTAIVRFLDTMEQYLHTTLNQPGKRCLFLMTADHGQTPIDPATTVYLNQTLPQITSWLRTNRQGTPLVPAGSARDFFLHIADEHLAEAADVLRAHLHGRAEVFLVDDLIERGFFGPKVSALFRSRVGNLVICPYRGESVWWYERGRFEQRFYGSHGGLTADEMETIVYATVYG